MSRRLKRFLARYSQEHEAAKALMKLRRKFKSKHYQQYQREPSPIGATTEEIKAWAKQLVTRREAKKKSKKAKKNKVNYGS